MLAVLSISSSSSGSLAEARRLPAKRSYDTHAYYVLELGEGSSAADAEGVAGRLGAELVEQVGELRDHWLLRAEHRLVARRSQQDQDQDEVVKKYREIAQEQRQHAAIDWRVPSSGKHRDLLSSLTSRSTLSGLPNILSLEKQVVKQRVKRQIIPALPPGTVNGQPQAAGGSNPVSAYLSDLAERFSILDPLWPKQWHLANDQMRENSINVTGVWDMGVTGKGVKVAIVDDGLDS